VLVEEEELGGRRSDHLMRRIVEGDGLDAGDERNREELSVWLEPGQAIRQQDDQCPVGTS